MLCQVITQKLRVRSRARVTEHSDKGRNVVESQANGVVVVRDSVGVWNPSWTNVQLLRLGLPGDVVIPRVHAAGVEREVRNNGCEAAVVMSLVQVGYYPRIQF